MMLEFYSVYGRLLRTRQLNSFGFTLTKTCIAGQATHVDQRCLIYQIGFSFLALHCIIMSPNVTEFIKSQRLSQQLRIFAKLVKSESLIPP
jgi:hypothetical protein